MTAILRAMEYLENPACLYAVKLLLPLVVIIWFWLWRHHSKRESKRYTRAEEEQVLAQFEPAPLVPDVDLDDPMMHPRLVQSKVGKHVVVEGSQCLNLAAHNYLGLLGDSSIEEAACQSLRKYGVGSCGPRGFYGTMDVHLELEERLAKFMNMEEAIVYSYGFSTMASAIPAYCKRGDVIFADEAVNFAIQKGLDAARSQVYFYKHNDMQDLERLLLEQQARDKKQPGKAAKIRRFLIAEGIYQNTGEICPLPQLVRLRAQHKLRLLLDESLSIGTLGKTGRGLTEHFNVPLHEVDLIGGSLEWVLGSIGGFCVGSSFITEHQRLSGLGYCFSASLPPMLAQTAISALTCIERNPQMITELAHITSYLHDKFNGLNILQLRGNRLSPVKHLYLTTPWVGHIEAQLQEHRILARIANECIIRGVVVVEASYLYARERQPMRPSLRMAASRLLSEHEVDDAFAIIKSAAEKVLT